MRRTALAAGVVASAAGVGLLVGHHHATVTVTSRAAVVPVPVPSVFVTARAEPPALPAAPPPPTVTTEQVEPAPAPPPRAATPLVNGLCLLNDHDAPRPPSCSWDDGFPAISADGRRVATRYWIDDGGRGNPNLRIHILDVATSRRVDDLLVLSADEYDSDDRDALRATIAQRSAAIQQRLDAGGYRSLTSLGYHGQMFAEPEQPPASGWYAEVDGELVRAVDADRHQVLWQHRFSNPAPAGLDPDIDLCAGWALIETGVWWDPATRVAVVDQTYRTGGCMCSDEVIEHVARMR